MAPSPHGAYWDEAQKLGYQDAGSWTLFKSTPVDRRKAAWLYAQFTVSKSVATVRFVLLVQGPGAGDRAPGPAWAQRARPSRPAVHRPAERTPAATVVHTHAAN